MQGASYEQYLARRGFPPLDPPGPFYRYMFLSCWVAPGFHMFWRRWSPLAGFALFRLYLRLGGRRHHHAATLGVFLVSGALHDVLLSVVLGRLSLALTGTWLAWGVFSLLAQAHAQRVGFRRWPAAAPALSNIVLIALGLWFGLWLQPFLLGSAAA